MAERGKANKRNQLYRKKLNSKIIPGSGIEFEEEDESASSVSGSCSTNNDVNRIRV